MISEYDMIGAAWRDHLQWKTSVNRSLAPYPGAATLSGVQLWVLAGVLADMLKVAHAFGNDSLQERMSANANAALASIGLPPPRGITFKLLLNTDDVVHIVVPGPPFGEALTGDAASPRLSEGGEYPWGDVGGVVARAWADRQFRERFVKEPREILATHVAALPEGVTVKVLTNTERLVYVVLWPSP
jgi:hypothetical protein